MHLRGADIGVVDHEAAVVGQGDPPAGEYMRQYWCHFAEAERRRHLRHHGQPRDAVEDGLDGARNVPETSSVVSTGDSTASTSNILFRRIDLGGPPLRHLVLGLRNILVRRGRGHGEALYGHEVLEELWVVPHMLHGCVCLVEGLGGLAINAVVVHRIQLGYVNWCFSRWRVDKRKVD